MKRFVLVLAMGSAFAYAASPKQQPVTWTGSWAAAPSTAPGPKEPKEAIDASNTSGSTYRNIVHLSLGGSGVRLRISNEFGNMPLTLGSVHVALSAGKNGTTQPATDHVVTFGGKETVAIPTGAMIISDPVAMPVDAFADLTVSLFVPAQPGATMTCHPLGVSSNYIAEGNAAAAPKLDGAKRVASWYLLKGVDVLTPLDATAVITLGDSITDGAHSTPDANTRWPNVLAERLQANKATAHIAVLDEGISGNRLLHDLTGPSMLERLDRDLSQSGAKYVIVLIGINDIGTNMRPRVPGEPKVTADQLTWGLQQVATRAHARGLKIYGATLTPFAGAKYQDADGLALHEAENSFIRTSGVFDGVIDFDKTTRDPIKQDTFLPLFDSGDHLHPGDAGYKAMGDSIDLKLFQ